MLSMTEEIIGFLNDLDEVPVYSTDQWWADNAERIVLTAESQEIRDLALKFLRGDLDSMDLFCSIKKVFTTLRDNNPNHPDVAFVKSLLDGEDDFLAENSVKFIQNEMNFLLSMQIPKLNHILRAKVAKNFDSRINWVMSIAEILMDYRDQNTN